jgi:hypothetical protein
VAGGSVGREIQFVLYKIKVNTARTDSNSHEQPYRRGASSHIILDFFNHFQLYTVRFGFLQSFFCSGVTEADKNTADLQRTGNTELLSRILPHLMFIFLTSLAHLLS